MLSLCSCSSTKLVSSPAANSSKQLSVAVLPIDVPAGMAREKADYLRNLLISELKNAGYLVLEDAATLKYCSTAACPEKAKLAKNFMVDSFASLQLKPFVRANFLAGYVNSISGELIVEDTSGAQLYKVSETLAEKGGLLFNSGQLFQGLKTQLDSAKTDAFDKLSDKFAQNLVAKLPVPKASNPDADLLAVSIGKVQVARLQSSVTKICADATPHSLVSVLVGTYRPNLREVSPGKYCGILNLGNALFLTSAPRVEARSAFGAVAWKELSRDSFDEYCATDKLAVTDGVLTPNCTLAAPICENLKRVCARDRFQVYTAQTFPGPFQKNGEAKLSTLLSTFKLPSQAKRIELVAVGNSGRRSTPIEVER